MSDAVGMERDAHPSLVLLGMAKSGTTATQGYIANAFSADFFSLPAKKESNFLSTRPPLTEAAIEAYREQLNVTEGVPFTLDTSPGYMHRGAIVSANLRVLNPNAVLIMHLREPVSRARNFYNYIYSVVHKVPYGNVSFEDVISFELDAFEEMTGARALLDTMLARDTSAEEAEKAINDLNVMLSARALLRGRGAYQTQSLLLSTTYTACLARWQDHFVPGRSLVLQSELLSSNSGLVLRQVLHPLLFGGRGQALSDEPFVYARTLSRWRPRPPRRYHYAADLGLSAPVACRAQKFFEPFLKRVREQLAGLASSGKAYVVPLVDEPDGWWKSADFCRELGLIAR